MQCNVSVKSKLQHTPPRATPRAFDFFENYCSNSPLPGPKCRSNAPHWCPFRWSNAPNPGTFHRHKNDRRTAETPSVVEQNLYKYKTPKVVSVGCVGLWKNNGVLSEFGKLGKPGRCVMLWASMSRLPVWVGLMCLWLNLSRRLLFPPNPHPLFASSLSPIPFDTCYAS